MGEWLNKLCFSLLRILLSNKNKQAIDTHNNLNESLESLRTISFRFYNILGMGKL